MKKKEESKERKGSKKGRKEVKKKLKLKKLHLFTVYSVTDLLRCFLDTLENLLSCSGNMCTFGTLDVNSLSSAVFIRLK